MPAYLAQPLPLSLATFPILDLPCRDKLRNTTVIAFQALIYNRRGKARIESGPKRVSCDLINSSIQKNTS